MPRVMMLRRKRDSIETPLNGSISKENAAIELIKATTINAKRGKKDLGRGLENNRGMVIRTTKMING